MPDSSSTRAGIVALVGRPNAGKSTLLNAFLGERLSIVSPRAQTTWQRVTGIHTSERAQVVFVDTPGLLEVRDLFQRALLAQARESLHDADIVLFVVDATRPLEEARGSAVAELSALSSPLFVAVNKVDRADPSRVRDALQWAGGELQAQAYAVSALEGGGVADLRRDLEDALPASPFLYPEDDLASQPVRFFVAELVRETIFERYRQEIPYSVVCEVEEFRESENPVYVRVVIHAERASQKGILLGEGGRAIKALGEQAREKVEHLIGRDVYLDLWVKTLPGWRRKRAHLARFGFHVPEEP